MPANIGVGLEWHAGTLGHWLEGAEERASGFGGALGDGRDDRRVENVAAVDGGGREGLWGVDDGAVIVEAHGDFAPGEVLLVAEDRDEFVFFHGVFGDVALCFVFRSERILEVFYERWICRSRLLGSCGGQVSQTLEHVSE